VQGAVIEAVQDAGQRFGQAGDGEGKAGGQLKEICIHDALWNNDVLGIRAVDKKQIVTQVWQISATVVTAMARGGIVGHDTHAWCNPFDLGPDGFDGTAEFMPKYRWRGDHARMPALQEDFQVGATGCGSGDAHEHVALPQGGQRQVFE
jgi:hypothetical protein